METVSIKETSPNVWRVSFNGNVLGDSRGHRKEGAIAEAKKFVADETRWAARDGRPAELEIDPALEN